VAPDNGRGTPAHLFDSLLAHRLGSTSVNEYYATFLMLCRLADPEMKAAMQVSHFLSGLDDDVIRLEVAKAAPHATVALATMRLDPTSTPLPRVSAIAPSTAAPTDPSSDRLDRIERAVLALASATASPYTSHTVASRGAPVDAAAAMIIARELEAAHPTRNRPSAHAVPQASVAAAQSSHSDQTLLSVLASLLGHLPASAAAVQPSLPRLQQRSRPQPGSQPRIARRPTPADFTTDGLPICFGCHKPGHVRRDCPLRPQPGQGFR